MYNESVKVAFIQTRSVPVPHCWQPDDHRSEVINPAARLSRHVRSQHTHPRICINHSPLLFILAILSFLFLSFSLQYTKIMLVPLAYFMYLSVFVPSILAWLCVCFSKPVFLWLCYMVVLVFFGKKKKSDGSLFKQYCTTNTKYQHGCDLAQLIATMRLCLYNNVAIFFFFCK